ncbi:hypothetical protein G4B84_004786 [Aspergillus flavus NRRL3357]|nr:uncharacterized protein G4B84_004786 [Aspergillus flavus NRRL3357]QMW29451.1 hypothetical protein G4B84_004786 [Aspergillus flavus NRRL3357]
MDFTAQGAPAFDPRFKFFEPVPAKLLLRPVKEEDYDPVFPDRIALRRTPNTKILSSFGPEWFGFSEAEYRFRRPLHHASSGTDWITMNLWDRLDRRFPNIKCTLISNEYADDELLSSELLLITRLMWQRRIRSMTLDHDIVPILVFSLMGTQHVRILQAHFDGSTLIRLKSKTLDLTTRDDEALDLLGQWYCSDPVGNTMWDEPVRTGTV